MLETSINELSVKFDELVEPLSLSLQADSSDASKQVLKMIDALRQNIQVMIRFSSDVESNAELDIKPSEISEIADFALNLLDEVSQNYAAKGMQEQMLELHRLSLPVINWVALHGGQVKKLDIVVNAIASYANTLKDLKQLAVLSEVIGRVVEVTDTEIKKDLEATNPMRPWRILNLNWGIVATRTHSTEIMQQVFDQLIKNIPVDAQQFFNEGMQQMKVVAYPEHVKVMMRKYAGGFGVDGVVH